jgi:hypothetical protein
MNDVNENNNSIKNTTNKVNLIHHEDLIERGHNLFTIKEENEPLLCDNIHNNTVSYSNYSYSYPQWGHPKNYVFYKNINGIFFPFLMCFLPFVNTIMLTFVLYSINQINNVASILSNPNVTNTITKIEDIIDYLCQTKVIEC